jgi:sigma-E factor negative regulatory protein RseC
MEEIGCVTGYGEDGRLVCVEIEAREACRHCSGRNVCSPFGDDKKMLMEAVNEIGAQPGDVVRIEMESSSTLGAAFLLYILPVLGLFLGYILGESLTGKETYGIIVALLAVAVTFVILRVLNPLFSGSRRFKPVVSEIIRHGRDGER